MKYLLISYAQTQAYNYFSTLLSTRTCNCLFGTFIANINYFFLFFLISKRFFFEVTIRAQYPSPVSATVLHLQSYTKDIITFIINEISKKQKEKKIRLEKVTIPFLLA